jgi:hypothetical protein
VVVGFAQGAQKARSQNESLVNGEYPNPKGKPVGHQSFDVEEDHAGPQKRKNLRGVIGGNLDPSRAGKRPQVSGRFDLEHIFKTLGSRTYYYLSK